MTRPGRVLCDRTTTEVPTSSLLVVPVGSCEQHGPHLPLATDTIIATWLARQIASAFPRAIEGPPITIGASGEHEGFAGTLSIGVEVLELVVRELIRSARASFQGVIVVNGHGGNSVALDRAALRARDEGDAVLIVHASVPGADAHAGHAETSMLLAIDDTLVKVGSAVPGNTEPLETIFASIQHNGVRAVSANGILGDPTAATIADGRALLDGLSARTLERVARWEREVAS